MKKFMKKNKKIFISLLLILIIIIVGGISLFNTIKNLNKSGKKEISKESYFVQYDKTWKVIKETENEIDFKHKKSNNFFNIKINELKEENRYKTIDEILDNVIYNIQHQNDNYKLIYKENVKLSRNNMDGYNILFENSEKQLKVSFYKQGDKIIIFTFEASFEYYDILLDSVNNIINNFSANEQKYDIATEINIKTEEVVLNEISEIDNELIESKEYQIANANYLVKYSIPSNFELQDYDSKYGDYKFKDKNIQLKTSIIKCNIYEYLDEENSVNVYNSYNLNNYNKEKAVLNKLSDEPLVYIYKNSYLSKNQITDNVAMIYELDNTHSFIVEISSDGIEISKELVNRIKVNETKNIASNITIEKDNDKLIGRLRRFTDYTKEKVEEITLKLPDNYIELDKDNNMYEERYYALNYDEEKEIYEYEVNYQTITFGINSQLDILDKAIYKDYGKYTGFEQINDININDKTFKAYKRGYTEKSYATDKEGNRYKYYANEIVLFYKKADEEYLVIIIKGNKGEIGKEQIEQLTKFDINIK